MKLIMENWKKFLTEGAGGTRGANKTNYLKKYKQLYLNQEVQQHYKNLEK